MAKREFIDKKDVMNITWNHPSLTLDDSRDDFRELPTFTEKDIVKPYLKKLSNEVNNHAVEFELFGISDEYISIGILQGIIVRLLSDKEIQNEYP